MIRKLVHLGFINIGTDRLEHVEATKVQTTNLVSVVTCVVALLYALYFLLSLNQTSVAAINLVFVACYGVGLLFSHKRFYRGAKVWFFTVLMAHVYLFSVHTFGVGAGFHFYYLIITPGVFLLFNENDRVEKFVFSLAGGILFYLCSEAGGTTPIISLDGQSERQLFYSVIYVTMIETYFIMALLSHNIDLYQKELKALAATDALTGINNRRMFMSIGEELFENAKRYQHPMSLLLLDIDYFKKINDVHGHLVGDEALKQVAATLKANLRASDSLARYGGEEFVVVLPETDIASALAVAENLRHAISAIQIELPGEAALTFTVSIGAAEKTPDTPCLMGLLTCADNALYRAKETGRNKVINHGQDEEADLAFS
ncbi:GGDEF domain-containing protein [Pseudoalteromonas sp. T1lg22]|uniref:GGDEF domain-containing protein n=1 Tax=Pseudoalteromonas sp. T1lg22 TaxID=2077096 RepID=UPI000CF6F831|nr:GGDEF domain-containing protein [Pseudoalteromonas sp. T1lg22]